MHAIYDYIFTTITLVLMITLTLNRLYGITDTLTSTISQDDLQAKAEEVLNKILLTPGDPPNWGTNPEVTDDTLKDFGLALAGGKPYELDMNKLRRLFDEDLPELTGLSLISLDRVYDLLGIKGKYAFAIRILPALNVTVVPINEDEGKFKVRVLTQDGLPVPNAEVYVTYLAGHSTQISFAGGNVHTVAVYHALCTSSYTDYKGEVTLDIGGKLQSIDIDLYNLIFGSGGISKTNGYVFNVFVRYHKIQTSISYSNLPGYELQGIIVGNKFYVKPEVETISNSMLVRVNLDSADSGDKKSTGPLLNTIAIVTPIGSVKVIDVNSKGNVFHFLFNLHNNKPQVTIVLSDSGLVMGSYIPPPSGITIGPRSVNVPKSSEVVTLRRLVWISGSMYYLDFIFWRVSGE